MTKRLDIIYKMQVETNILLKEMNRTQVSNAPLPVMTVRPRVKPSISQEELSALAAHKDIVSIFNCFLYTLSFNNKKLNIFLVNQYS